MASQGTEEIVTQEFYLAKKPAGEAEAEWTSYEDLLVHLAMQAEKAERYDDMCQFLTEVVNSKFTRTKPLLENERNLLSVAFKNVVGSLRSSWRTFKNTDQEYDADLLTSYQSIVEHELEKKCLEVLTLLENKLIPVCPEASESKVFYLKMSGDYYRYLAEFCEKEEYKNKAQENYQNALDEARTTLAETHPTRLGLALNFSVCYYEILKEQQKACQLAKKAFDEAIQKLDTLNDANYKDSTLIMQLLRDNLTLWTSEVNEENED